MKSVSIESDMQYLRLVLTPGCEHTEWCSKPTYEKCPDEKCEAPCKHRAWKGV